MAGRPASNLRCISLFSTAAGEDASGRVELGRVPSPFAVTVTPEGHHIAELTATIEGLPDPAALGPYTTYVAWATPLELDPVVRLGEVGDGETALGQVSFNKYLILVTAEASADVEERTGPLVLRGRSPSALMEAHDLLALAPSATQTAAVPPGDEHDHPGAGTWEHPPMYPGIPMLPGIMALEPGVAPLELEATAGLPPLDELPAAVPGEVVRLPDGGTLDLEANVVRRQLAGRRWAALAFNGQHPGPLIQVRERSTIFVNFTNRTPFPTAVHWHGIRLDNPFDGVPGVTQDPVEPGESFRYRIFFRDAGIYWYHPHHREDVQQELGLYGNLLVESPDPDYYGPVHNQQILILDDLLLDETGPVTFGAGEANYALMGRFGNTLLVNGELDYRLELDRGEVVRFHLTNASNTRTFNLSWVPAGAPAEPLPIKVLGSDVGRYEREELVRSVVLAPAERYVVEVRFDQAGPFDLVNVVQGIDHRRGVFLPERRILGRVLASDRPATPDLSAAFETLRENEAVRREIDAFREHFEREPDRRLVLTLETAGLPGPIERSMAYDWVYFNPVEWTGTMPMMNWATTAGDQIRWILRDPDTGAENEAIDWQFRVGDVVKLRVVNDRSAFHAMQHPLHIHGQRFLVVAQDGVPNENLVWKDTVLLPVGSTTDIVLELSNPGRWMVHCHIAEHLEAGMKLVMDVAPDQG